MHQDKSHRLVRHQLMLTAILLFACFALLVSATWARYRTDKIGYLEFAAAPTPDSISLYAGNGWTYSDTSGTLFFSIDNSSDTADYSDKTQTISIRLIASLSLATISADNVKLTITNGTSTSTYAASAIKITEGTTMYQTFGAGQAYIFTDSSGNELSLSLQGGVYSSLSGYIEITGLKEIENAALLQLQVVGQ